MSDAFVSSWSFYDKLIVKRPPGVKHEISIELPNNLTDDALVTSIREFAESQAAKTVEGKDPESLLTKRYLRYYDSKSMENFQVDMAVTELRLTRNAVSSPPTEVIVDTMTILAKLANHPAFQFLTQGAVDEIVTMAASAFISGKFETSKSDPSRLYVALVFWMYLMGHKREDSRIKDPIETWTVWNLVNMWRAKTGDEDTMLLSLTPDDSALYIRKLFSVEACNSLFSPLVVRLMRQIEERDAGQTVQSALQGMLEYCARELPQLRRAFPQLCKDEQMINLNNWDWCSVKCSTCKSSPKTDVSHLLSTTPNLIDPEVETAGTNYLFQHELFNRTRQHTLDGVQCTEGHTDGRFDVAYRVEALPRFLILNLTWVFDDKSIQIGPCVKNGRFGYYRLYSKEGDVQIYERIDPKVD